ncbi:M56 family metallopeptidase [Candidatus Agathobaculum pullicola]|uniref:M56 family metallopeptidase n=1 Tax=Candidatus Agathobaculum pullicola TaxID=2838426 RepID=UPI003F8F753D
MLRFAWSDLLNNLMQIGLTVSAVALALFLLRKALNKRYPARAMCLVWAVLALRLLIPVQLTLPDPPVQVTPRTTYLTRTDFAPAQLEQAGLPVREQDGEITTRRWVTDEQAQTLQTLDEHSWTAIDMGRVLLVIWGTGALLFAVWQLYLYLTFHYVLEKSSHPVERDTLLAVFEAQKRSLGIRRTIPLRVTSAADCPLLAGFVQPALYLPDEALSEQDAAFIFRHELTHYKRGDLWLKLALVAARAVHWFNPLVHLMARLAQEDIELACDDAVVRGMDVSARRAYGETILRAVEAQMKKRALVSCFAGDKETLMRRFEGLFDNNVKRRGMALVVAAAVLVGTLGCAFSVGESGEKLTEETRRALAEQWAQRTENLGYMVKLDGEDTYVLYNAELENLPDEAASYRMGEKLVFEQGADGWQVAKAEPVAPDGVTSLDEFRLLYENDLGLPDPISGGDMVLTDAQQKKWSDPVDAAADLLHLQIGGVISNPSADDGLGDDIVNVAVEFPDHSEVTITMVSQFGAGWLPQDFTYDGGKNERTAADLVGQYARGVTHKGGQFIYPILSAQMQQAFRSERQMESYFNWKYGGSSPSYSNYALVPTDDADSYLAVFQMYGGGVEDIRSAYLIRTAQEDGRRVIERVVEAENSDYTKSELFKLYYDSGLPWPTIPEGAGNFNGASLDTLTRVRDAAETVFSYFGEQVEHIEGDTHLYTMESWFTSEVISEGDTEAVVRLHFTDNSPSVDVQMRKTGDYWLPVGLAGQFAEGFSATVNGEALPVGSDVQQAVQNAAGEVPLLAAGDRIELLFDPAPEDAVTVEDAIIRADGTLQYDDKMTERSTFSYTGNAASMTYTYLVERLMVQEALSSAPDMTMYRGVTLTYTANGTDYTVAFVYRLANGDVPNPDDTIHSTAYYNDTYGYTLTLPDCFVEQGYVKENDDRVQFGLQNALPGYTDDPTDGGAVMTLQVQATAALKAQFGEDWEAEYPIPCKQLTERDGLTYYLAFASDVQYDPSDAAITAAYTEMYQAAQAMDSSSISFDGQSDAQAGRARQQVLHDLATQYGYTLIRKDGSAIDAVTVEPNVTDGSCLLTVRYVSRERNHFFTTVQRLWYEGIDSITPTRTETLVDTSDGVRSRADFLLAFPQEQGIPELDRTGIDTLLAEPTLDPAQDAERVLGLSGGMAEDIVIHPIKKRYTFTYRWPDGTVDFIMQGVTLGGAEQPIYLPVAFDGKGWFADPYTYMMCKESGDFSMCTVEALVWYLAQSDGATTEGILTEMDKRWQQDADAVEQAMDGADAVVQTLWQQHKAANPDIFGARFSEEAIEAACQTVRDYAGAHGFSVDNLHYDASSEYSWSQGMMKSGVLQDNVRDDGLTIDNVITVIGDARFSDEAWRDTAEGWSFTLYRGTDGKWVLEDGAYGY